MDPRAAPPPGVPVPATITCVECLGTCHRLSHVPEGGFEPGDWVAYRCADCLDRFDLQVEDPAEDAGDRPD